MHSDNYAPFLFAMDDSAVLSMKDFCLRDVEAFGRDADHLQISALSSALKVSLNIIYLSNSSKQSQDLAQPNSQLDVDSKDPIPCDTVPFDVEQDSILSAGPLLYRPGHFDLLVNLKQLS